MFRVFLRKVTFSSEKALKCCQKPDECNRGHPEVTVPNDQKFFFSMKEYGLLRWFSGKEPTPQCRRHGFDPWVGKIPWRRKWQPPTVFLPGKFHGWRSLVAVDNEVEKSWTQVSLHA